MIKIFSTIEELNRFAAEKFVEIAAEAIETRGKFTVALAGGSTPKSLYQLLSGERFKDKLDWTSVFFFFGDERSVLPNDAESNFRMANETLFEPLQISGENVYRWRTESADAEKIAENYEQAIKVFFSLAENDLPEFDLILLGMGADGHTASLFPFTKALKETKRIAVANYVEKLNTNRLTLTFPVINNASNIIFLVSGESKAEALQEILEGEPQTNKFPSQNVRPDGGKLIWMIDRAAARLLQ
jgi:6-phosphogluconolactonase